MKYTLFFNTIKAIEKDVEGFSIEDKEYSKFQLFLCKLLYVFKYKKVWTSMYPKVWRPIADLDKKTNFIILQHEWVHLKDGQTLFGLIDKKYKYFNLIIYTILYSFPQFLALFSLLCFINPWFLLFSVFILPLPAPFRTLSEIRAYRRTLELSKDQDKTEDRICETLCSIKYYWAMPFKRKTKKLLKKSSPYKDEMDKPLKI